MHGIRHIIAMVALLGLPILVTHCAHSALADTTKPNIVVIMVDDLGYWNVGAYSRGMMGIPTKHIDRIGEEGIIFTDHYSEPTCTPGRAAFLTGQMPIRTGLTTVGMPGSPIGLDKRDPTLAEVLKGMGYSTGQFGKSHVGDRNEHLPTVHGFDEFFGNLYHLNTEEEPELLAWPKSSEFDKRYRPRGVLDCAAADVDDPTTDARFGRVGKQKIRDTGPLTSKRMETVDDEFLSRALQHIERNAKAKKPFFTWLNPTRMHIYTHLRPERAKRAAEYSSEFDVYGSGLLELDDMVGKVLGRLDELGIADDTIVAFTTDNGAMADWYPDGGATPFRGEKATTWEGGVRVPMLVRWPKRIPARKVSNGIQTHYDLFTTLIAAAGDTSVADRLRDSHKVHIDGVNNLEHWVGDSPSRREVLYYYNEAQLTAIRIKNWKSHFMTRSGFFDFNTPNALIVNLRSDPFERHLEWKSREVAMRLGIAWGGQVQDAIAAHSETLNKYPPRQKGGTLTPGVK